MNETLFSIRRLSSHPVERMKRIEEILKKAWVNSEFIDPVKDILNKIEVGGKGAPHIPYGVYVSEQVAGFFTIDLENPSVASRVNNENTCWLESFFISRPHQGKGYAGSVLKKLPVLIGKEYPFIKNICLTVNFRNEIAQSLYLKYGFYDTGETHPGGPVGPQHIYRMPLR